MRGKRGQLIAGLVLLTLGALFILDRLIILEIYISWPVILVAVGVALFLIDPQSLASWIVGGIGVILFIVNFAIAFFPEVEAWSDLIWPTILVIIGVLLLYRYYQTPSPKPPAPAQPPPPKQAEQGAKTEEPPKSAE
jgi:membrane-bound ClpP family serine protease